MMTATEILSTDTLARKAPAIFASAPHSRMSAAYSFLRTIDLVEALRGAGWLPVYAAQSKVRDLSRDGMQRHVVRLRHQDAQLKVGDSHAELVLVNSHDGSSAYQMHAGIFRLVCGNGLIVADATFAKVAVKHVGVKLPEIVEASFQVVREVPKLTQSIEGMRSVHLTGTEQVVFANAAASLRWEDGKAPVVAEKLLEARRYEDKGSDLWTTFNRVQENIVRGGQRGIASNGRRTRTRAIGSVTEDTRLNKALWHLAEEMRRLKTA